MINITDKDLLEQWTKQEREKGLINIHLDLPFCPSNAKQIYNELVDMLTAPHKEDKELY